MKSPHTRRRILVVLGTRPEAIKLAPVIHALQAAAGLTPIVCSTGQHRQMLDSVLELFGISPDFDLDLMRPGQDLTDLTARLLPALRDVITEVKPSAVMVQGDTATAMSAAIAAYFQQVPVVHVEAGLRTNDIYAPWPEEVNRKIISTMTALHLAPTSDARDNLLREGVPEARILVTGNTVVDALLSVSKGIDSDDAFKVSVEASFPFLQERVGLASERSIVLVTGHRRENFGEGFLSICEALRRLALRNDVQIVYPVHLNPNVQEPVIRLLGDIPNIHLIEPLDYRTFVYFMQRSKLILTDSGGVQEEAPSLGRPVLVMRAVTERGEAVKAGTVRLVGTDTELIVAEVSRLLDDPEVYEEMALRSNPYGDGHASERIVEALGHFEP